MKNTSVLKRLQRALVLAALAALPGAAANAATVPLHVHVVDDSGKPITGSANFRWQLELDNTSLTTPNIPQNDSVSVAVHKSHAPVVGNGSVTTGASEFDVKVGQWATPTIVPPDTKVLSSYVPDGLAAPTADPERGRYLLSVLSSGYSVGGIALDLTGPDASYDVKVVLNKHQVPTAQISILVFHDNNPINNEPDADEPGLPGFRVLLSDQVGGPIKQDAFANPIGTTYQLDPASTKGDYLYDQDGAPIVEKMGSGFIYTDKSGKALIKNLWMGKIGVQVVPPVGEDWTAGHGRIKDAGDWHQTATIEGTLGVDVWVAPNEPRVFIEGFGTGFYHAFFGFVDPEQLPGLPKAPSPQQQVTVKGRLLWNHFGRPPATAASFPGAPVTDAWVGINQSGVIGAAGHGLWAASTSPQDGTFSVDTIAPGLYEVVSWDKPLDGIWNFVNLNVPDPNNPADVNKFERNPNGSFKLDPITNNKIYVMPDILVNRWFGVLEGNIFYDANSNGWRDDSEEGISQMFINLRYRDGTVYQSTISDQDGKYALTEVFPFFKWLIAEVDFTRFKPTGMTAIVDDGGRLPDAAHNDSPAAIANSDGKRNPQPQFDWNLDGTLKVDGQGHFIPLNNDNSPIQPDNFSRFEPSPDPAAPVLLEAIQLYLGQFTRIDWGKINYGTTPDGRQENGGIAGVIGYGNTRAEADPKNGVIEPWDPGVPRTQVALYQFEPNFHTLALQHQQAMKNTANPVLTVNGVPADENLWKIKVKRNNPDPSKVLRPRLADVDNYPFGWADGTGARGPEDISWDDLDHSKGLTDFNPGDAVQIVHADSWDDAMGENGFPEGTQQQNPPKLSIDGGATYKPILGSDNFATWNQVRPGVFDGGYLFGSFFRNGMAGPENADPTIPADPNSTYFEETAYLDTGDYVVQMAPPPGYYVQTEEARNVFFGDGYKPSKLALNPDCIGDFHKVPAYQSLFPDLQTPSEYAGQWRPLADRKVVHVGPGRNVPCDFHVYTEVPKGTRVVGFVLNDLSAEFDPNNPTYGEKEAAGWIPVSFRDWQGHEIARSYADEYGSYTALVPSTYNAAVPCPSGFSPQMLTLTLNDPTKPSNPFDYSSPRIPDPYYNPGFSTTPWTLDYYPGTQQYADTPILPTAAFMGSPNASLDVEPPAGTPVIQLVEGTVLAPAAGGIGPFAGPYVQNLTDTITITSRGSQARVQDPGYRLFGTANLVERDLGFGSAPGKVVLTDSNGNETIYDVPVGQWTEDKVTFSLGATGLSPSGASEWRLTVVRSNGKVSPLGITLTYDSDRSHVSVVIPVDPAVAPADGSTYPTPIQDAIDGANNGDLVIVPYSKWDWNENPILWKPLRLQGAGPGSVINATPNPAFRLHVWHAKVDQLLGGDPFSANEAAGIKVFGTIAERDQAGAPSGSMITTGFGTPGVTARIDGFLIKGALQGGGISVFTKAAGLRISNNRLTGNQGAFSGGISVGMKDTLDVTYDNPGVVIDHNEIVKNASINGAGGVGLFTGATGYRVENNYIVGNFATSDPGVAAGTGVGAGGGGIAHEGLSPGGVIANNVIAFNEVFFGYANGGGDGGGLYITGENDATTGLSTGSGSITIINNLIQGNLAAAGNGGGIRASGVNGFDVLSNSAPDSWYVLKIYNNIIVDNVAGDAAGGISLADSIRTEIVNNTIVNNDSTSIAHVNFSVNALESSPQGAGIVLNGNSQALQDALPAGSYKTDAFSNPILKNDIIWHNRSFHFKYGDANTVVQPGVFQTPDGLLPNVWRASQPDLPEYNDIAINPAGQLAIGGVVNPQNVYTTASGSGSSDPLFKRSYLNTLITAVIPDEAGNGSISLRFDHLGLYANSGITMGGTPVTVAPDPFANPTTINPGDAQGDYHLQLELPVNVSANVGILALGLDVTSNLDLAHDYDGQGRPAAPDLGADQASGALVVAGILPGAIAPTVTDLASVGPRPDVTSEPPFTTPDGPLIPPTEQIPPTPNNPIYMAADPSLDSNSNFAKRPPTSSSIVPGPYRPQSTTINNIRAFFGGNPLPAFTYSLGLSNPAPANPWPQVSGNVITPDLGGYYYSGISQFTDEDLLSLSAFAYRLQAQAGVVADNDPNNTSTEMHSGSLAAYDDPVAALIYSLLRPGTRGLLAAYTGGVDDALFTALIGDPGFLNKNEGVNRNKGILNSISDILDPAALTSALVSGVDPISTYIRQQLNVPDTAWQTSYEVLLSRLNSRIIQIGANSPVSLYGTVVPSKTPRQLAFEALDLSPETVSLLDFYKSGDLSRNDTVYLNRLLLVAAYPEFVAPRQAPRNLVIGELNTILMTGGSVTAAPVANRGNVPTLHSLYETLTTNPKYSSKYVAPDSVVQWFNAKHPVAPTAVTTTASQNRGRFDSVSDNWVRLNRLVIEEAFSEIRRWPREGIHYMHLAAGDGFSTMADGTVLYTFGYSDQTSLAAKPKSELIAAGFLGANGCAPTIEVNEGSDFLLDLSNVAMGMRPDLFDPHTVHFHGFAEAAPIFDGMPMSSIAIHEAGTLRYYYKLVPNFSAGTYFYHCHVEATEHMQQGMIGNLWVNPIQNQLPTGAFVGHVKGMKYAYNDGDGSTRYDVQAPIQLTGFDHFFHDEELGIQAPAFATMFDTYPLINGRGYPDTVNPGEIGHEDPYSGEPDRKVQKTTALVKATVGQKILLRISEVNEMDFDTLTVLGIPMKVVAKDARLLRGPTGKDLSYTTTSVTLGGGETIDVILDTTGVKAGTYYIYSSRLSKLSNDQEDYGGLMTHIELTEPTN